MAKLKTIKVSGGAEYAKVSERLKEFHKSYKNGNIETSYSLTEAMICFKATIIPDIEKPARFFTGHSLGKIAGIKAFEKLETIAVGRALAFLGLLADGDIASADEMSDFKSELTEVDVSSAVKKISNVNSLEELRKVWNALSQIQRDDSLVTRAKDEKKKLINKK